MPHTKCAVKVVINGYNEEVRKGGKLDKKLGN